MCVEKNGRKLCHIQKHGTANNITFCFHCIFHWKIRVFLFQKQDPQAHRYFLHGKFQDISLTVRFEPLENIMWLPRANVDSLSICQNTLACFNRVDMWGIMISTWHLNKGYSYFLVNNMVKYSLDCCPTNYWEISPDMVSSFIFRGIFSVRWLNLGFILSF